MDTSLLLKHTSQLCQWLEKAPLSVVSKLTVSGFSKLSSGLSQTCSWAGLVTLYHSCPKHLVTLNPGQVCETLNMATVRLGPSVKVIDALGMLSDEQLGGISPEVSCHGYRCVYIVM